MATVNSASLREEFDAYKADIVSLRKEGEITEKTDKVLTGLCDLVTILTAAFLEKTTKKTNKNSSIPPSQTGKSAQVEGRAWQMLSGEWVCVDLPAK